MLSTAELTSLRATMESSFPSTITVRRATGSSDGQGGQTQTWADSSTPAGRLTQTSRFVEVVENGKVVAKAYFELLVPVGTDLTPKDRVRISSVDYEVVETDQPRSEAIALKAGLIRVT